MSGYEPNDSGPERPRSAPEIIPPGAPDPRRTAWTYSVDNGRASHRVFVARPGPFTLFLVLGLAGLIMAAIVLLLLGAVLFWIPVFLIIVGGFALTLYARLYWLRFKAWLARR